MHLLPARDARRSLTRRDLGRDLPGRFLLRWPVLAALVAVWCMTAASCRGDAAVGSASATIGSADASHEIGSIAPTTAAARDRVVLHGTAELDGSPFDADFIGAVVRDGGLVTACQVDLPPVAQGRYEIAVYGAGEGHGCGHPGTEIVLWTFAHDQRMFATTTVPWPEANATMAFDAHFSTASPAGPMMPVTELAGEVYDAAGARLGPGGRVEAFVGTTRCGLSTVRETGDFVGFSLSVVGPDAIPQCLANAPITFVVDGHPARETLDNDASLHRSFDLTVP